MSGCVTRLSVVPATGPRGCRLQSQPIGRAALKTLKKKLKKTQCYQKLNNNIFLAKTKDKLKKNTMLSVGFK